MRILVLNGSPRPVVIPGSGNPDQGAVSWILPDDF